jgi:hypothetical protein
MPKKVKLIIMVIVGLFLVYLGYSVYFTSKEGTESFGNFDTNSTANKNIKVELLMEKGFTASPDGGVSFYVKDRSGIIKKVTLGKAFPEELKKAGTITLTGHLHGDYFHATEVAAE